MFQQQVKRLKESAKRDVILVRLTILSTRPNVCLHCKKRLAIFPSSAGMSLSKLSLAGNNLIIPLQGEFGYSDDPAGDGKITNPFTVYLVI